jgi:effector-binding domain-containing protein
MDGNPETRFQLEICIPVEENDSIQSENAMHIPGFTCASKNVDGPWTNLKEGYEELMSEIAKKGYVPGQYCREVYHEVDFEHPENNRTEILMGVN